MFNPTTREAPSIVEMLLNLRDAARMAQQAQEWLQKGFLEDKDPIATALGTYDETLTNSGIQPDEILDLGSIDVEGLRKLMMSSDRLAKKIDEAVRAGQFDSRSVLSDARLNYGNPYQYVYLEDAPSEAPEH